MAGSGGRAWLILEIDIGKLLSVAVADDEAGVHFLDSPRRREAAGFRHFGCSGSQPFHGILTSDFTVTTGIVSSLSGILNDTRFLQISAPVRPGNSGGPLLDTSGNVVGVVAEKLNAVKFAKVMGDLPENINFAIKTGAVRDFLHNSAVAYQTASPGTELKTAQVAENARKFTMLISCSADLTKK